jgi:plastocyanin
MRLAVGGAVGALLALGGILFLPISEEDPAAVKVAMTEYAFDPVDAPAEPGQELTISNDGAIPHSYLIVDLAKGVELQAGEERTLSLPGDTEPGTYRVICDLPGHVEEGMIGTLEVR